jgi:hypothetical protein
MLLHIPKTGHVLLHASKVKRVPIPCGLQTAGNNKRWDEFLRRTIMFLKYNGIVISKAKVAPILK